MGPARVCACACAHARVRECEPRSTSARIFTHPTHSPGEGARLSSRTRSVGHLPLSSSHGCIHVRQWRGGRARASFLTSEADHGDARRLQNRHRPDLQL
eukprot:2632990-Prymnesium_polylepis.1